MGWRNFLTDLNLVWTTVGIAVAGLTAAFIAGLWVSSVLAIQSFTTVAGIASAVAVLVALALGLLIGSARVGELRETEKQLQSELAQSKNQSSVLEQQLAERVETPPPMTLPSESVQIWLKPVSEADTKEAKKPTTCPVLLVANLKGGVAKTMLAANLAAYFTKRGDYRRTQALSNRRVLLIDLDYQGSLTRMVLRAMNPDHIHENSNAQTLFRSDIKHSDALNFRVHPTTRTPRLSFFQASYGFDDFETREQFHWLAGQTTSDIRFKLLQRLRSQEFLDAFDLVIIDTGPRLTTGSVAALCAATHLLVPSPPDARSMEAVERFLRRVSVMKFGGEAASNLASICPNLSLAGVIPTLTGGDHIQVALQRSAREVLTATVAGDAALRRLVDPASLFLTSTFPRSQPIVNEAESSIPYLADTTIRAVINSLGSEIEQRIFQ
jgi:cellulose biosynthesis protein BcsQ